jgi:tRNA-specific 2-thiouridylase
MEKKVSKIRVVVAMSGGVDSAVVAALLVRAGFEVIGVFMKFWAEEAGNSTSLPQNRCCSEESEQRARKTALQLGIPFYVLDLRDEFKKLIVDRFIRDTKKGLTPNPCVVCNQEIKFGLLIEKSIGMGAEFVATGHYAQIKKTKDGIYHLLKGKDKAKDQSYFLWRLSQKQLSRVIFPVGCFEKSEVRTLAKKWKLPSAATPESQEVCFVNGDIDKFLEKHCGTKIGDIVDTSGNVIGRHNGLWFYTIGQRKGIKLSGGPFYVVKKDFKRNQLVISLVASDSGSNEAAIGGALWVSGYKTDLPLKAKVKVRYRSKDVTTIVTARHGGYRLQFVKAQFAITPGQSAVIYRGRELLGGGIIENWK